MASDEVDDDAGRCRPFGTMRLKRKDGSGAHPAQQMKNERRKRKNERVEVGQYGYLYRGYPIGKNGAERKNWVYGELITVFGGTKIICREGGEIHIYDVVPTSVGRRTGLVDVLGTAIFEGDLIRRKDGHIFVVCYADCCGGFALSEADVPAILAPGLTRTNELIVIGNTMMGATSEPLPWETLGLNRI